MSLQHSVQDNWRRIRGLPTVTQKTSIHSRVCSGDSPGGFSAALSEAHSPHWDRRALFCSGRAMSSWDSTFSAFPWTKPEGQGRSTEGSCEAVTSHISTGTNLIFHLIISKKDQPPQPIPVCTQSCTGTSGPQQRGQRLHPIFPAGICRVEALSRRQGHISRVRLCPVR